MSLRLILPAPCRLRQAQPAVCGPGTRRATIHAEAVLAMIVTGGPSAPWPRWRLPDGFIGQRGRCPLYGRGSSAGCDAPPTISYGHRPPMSHRRTVFFDDLDSPPSSDHPSSVACVTTTGSLAIDNRRAEAAGDAG